MTKVATCHLGMSVLSLKNPSRDCSFRMTKQSSMHLRSELSFFPPAVPKTITELLRYRALKNVKWPSTNLY